MFAILENSTNQALSQLQCFKDKDNKIDEMIQRLLSEQEKSAMSLSLQSIYKASPEKYAKEYHEEVKAIEERANDNIKSYKVKITDSMNKLKAATAVKSQEQNGFFFFNFFRSSNKLNEAIMTINAETKKFEMLKRQIAQEEKSMHKCLEDLQKSYKICSKDRDAMENSRMQFHKQLSNTAEQSFETQLEGLSTEQSKLRDKTNEFVEKEITPRQNKLRQVEAKYHDELKRKNQEEASMAIYNNNVQELQIKWLALKKEEEALLRGLGFSTIEHALTLRESLADLVDSLVLRTSLPGGNEEIIDQARKTLKNMSLKDDKSAIKKELEQLSRLSSQFC